jgi:hypothetical protein
MSRAGSIILTNVREPTLTIVCEPCGRRGGFNVSRLIQQHGADAKLTDPAAGAYLLKDAFGERPWWLLPRCHVTQ